MYLTRKAIFRIAAIAALSLALFLYSEHLDHNRIISRVPSYLHVEKIIYAKESDDAGWGPGSNESGIFVYELAEDISNKIQAEGYTFFVTMSKARNPSNTYVGWYGTPIVPAPYWSTYPEGAEHDIHNRKPNIKMYLNRYGMGFDIPVDIQRLIEDSLATRDNYFAEGGSSITVVIPRTRKVIYAYAS